MLKVASSILARCIDSMLLAINVKNCSSENVSDVVWFEYHFWPSGKNMETCKNPLGILEWGDFWTDWVRHWIVDGVNRGAGNEEMVLLLDWLGQNWWWKIFRFSQQDIGRESSLPAHQIKWHSLNRATIVETAWQHSLRNESLATHLSHSRQLLCL